ncbi:hypothetical protein GDO81_016134 [Engystomops pustulosus]|uniref:Uncharacterized protein n=1 Tax=Engystomops pustulosus TaxID=76066 RepID=A0AAV7AUG0_ENGPU|nr:hypothetical protein GDO81_016133 [Engystomops pustulosus]KAG8563567.1 hypothetical protein GDO81_016134 [Engystomops pustulosus]
MREPFRKRKRQDETSSSAQQEPAHKRKKDDLTQLDKEMSAFLHLLEDRLIRLFLASDSRRKLSDKYLLAMVCEYFRRAAIPTDEYRSLFFPALFLTNQFEEEELEIRRQIYPWALGGSWTLNREQLLHECNLLFH